MMQTETMVIFPRDARQIHAHSSRSSATTMSLTLSGPTDEKIDGAKNAEVSASRNSAQQERRQEDVIDSVSTVFGIQVKTKTGFEPREVQVVNSILTKHFSPDAVRQAIETICQKSSAQSIAEFKLMNGAQQASFGSRLFKTYVDGKLLELKPTIVSELEKFVPTESLDDEVAFAIKLANLSIERKYTQTVIRKIGQAFS